MSTPPPCDEAAVERPSVPCRRPRGTLAATVLGSSLTFVVGAIV